jgi:uridylate kinase
MNNLPFRRVLLKISGESLMGSQSFGVSFEACLQIGKAIKEMRDAQLEVSVVIGGGNIFRGVNLKESGMERTPADQIGMLSTLINGLSLQQALLTLGCPTRVMSAIDCPKIAESYNWRESQSALKNGNIILFVGGTGNPYFTTDTAAALRASETHCDILLKATKVDGIYSKDPIKFSDAVKYPQLTYSQILAEKLAIMDATAIALCRSNQIPIFVFNMKNLVKDKIIDTLQAYDGSLVKE